MKVYHEGLEHPGQPFDGGSILAQTSSVLYLIASPDDPATCQRMSSHVDHAVTLDCTALVTPQDAVG